MTQKSDHSHDNSPNVLSEGAESSSSAAHKRHRVDFKDSDEINFLELWSIFVLYKKWVFLSIIIVPILLVTVSFMMTNKYTSNVLLAPVSVNANNVGKEIGGVAGLIGLNLGAGDGGYKQEAIATLKSRKFISNFIRKNNLKPFLFHKDWVAEKKQWRDNTNFLWGIIDALRDSKEIEYEGKEILLPGEPSMWLAYGAFSDMLTISEHKKTGMVTLRIESYDPIISRDIANKLVHEINEELRGDYVKKSKKTIQFLENQLRSMQLVELRQVVFNVMQEHIQNIALAHMQDAYVFKIIDPAVVAEEKSSPKRLLLLIFGIIAGLIIGVMLALILNWKKTASLDSLSEHPKQ